MKIKRTHDDKHLPFWGKLIRLRVCFLRSIRSGDGAVQQIAVIENLVTVEVTS